MKKTLAYLFAMCMLAAVALPMVACAPKSNNNGMEAAQGAASGESMKEGAQQEGMGEGMQQGGMDEGMQQGGMDEGMQQGSGMGEEAQQPAPSQM